MLAEQQAAGLYSIFKKKQNPFKGDFYSQMTLMF